jgi:hypothetical protein
MLGSRYHLRLSVRPAPHHHLQARRRFRAQENLYDKRFISDSCPLRRVCHRAVYRQKISDHPDKKRAGNRACFSKRKPVPGHAVKTRQKRICSLFVQQHERKSAIHRLSHIQNRTKGDCHRFCQNNGWLPVFHVFILRQRLCNQAELHPAQIVQPVRLDATGHRDFRAGR